MVAPDDIVVGELDGLVVVPRERAEEVHELSSRRHEADHELTESIESGSNERYTKAMAEVLRLEGLPTPERPIR